MAVVYCNRCGCENASTRGACLRCLNFIDTPEGTLSCSDCGINNAADALYCASCGKAVADVPPAVACSLEAAINLVLGGESDIGPTDDYDDDEIAPPGVPDIDFGEESEPEEEVEIAPPPPPAAPVAIAEVAPPPPPPAVEEIGAEAELFEPAADEPAFAPPPPPPAPEDISAEGLLDESDAAVAFEPAADGGPAFAPPEEEPKFADLEFDRPEPVEEAEEKADGAKKDDSGLGGWVIEFGDTDKKD